MNKVNINNKLRLTIFCVLLVSVITTVIFGLKVYGFKKPGYEKIKVRKGDTLWSISMKYKNENQDVRNYIYELKNINNLESSKIYPGTVLKITVR